MDIERSQNWHHRSGPPTKVGDVSLGEEEDEECEPIEMDPLVFDREEFNCGETWDSYLLGHAWLVHVRYRIADVLVMVGAGGTWNSRPVGHG